MSSEDGLDFPWFYDTEQRQHASTKDFSAAEIARRPWKAFWPPRSEDKVNIWLRSEFPEVLSWRFDPDRPFDQPWRNWLRSPLMKDEGGSSRKKFSWKNGNQADPSKSDPSSTSTANSEDQIAGLPKVRVIITYLAPLELYNTEKPYISKLPCGTGIRRTNIVESDHPVEIHDICDKEGLVTLDQAGFQFVMFPTKISDWTDESVQSEYVPALSEWLKEYFSCEKVFIYTYSLRTNDTKVSGMGPWKRPIFRVHCDSTAESCAKRLEFLFPTEAQAILGGRYRYINIWRCVSGQDTDSPLAFCDYRSIAPTDLRKVDIVYPHFIDEGYEVTYNPAHRWFYKKGMSKDDVVLFKLDDVWGNVAKFSPHVAFLDPSASGNGKRASIEVRAIIIG